VIGDAPDGFVPYRRSSPYLELIGPAFESADSPPAIGLWLDDRHVNSRGFVHAGLLVALADTILGHTILHTVDYPPIVTVSLTTDFIGSARPGAWLLGRAEVTRAGGRLAFASATFQADGRPVLTARGIFATQSDKPS
jgi:acyl-coenzyme A thioesterase PaaI-like protein